MTTSTPDAVYPNVTLTRLAFGSCHKNKYAEIFSNIWDLVEAATPDPQVWLWIGDAIYGGKGVADVEDLRGEYRRLKSSDSYASFLARDPDRLVFGTWDDHE